MFFLNKKNGFTLVEMMVAIAVFSLVMVVALSALINVIDANKKAQTVKTAINNISFALEGLSKDMRMGTEYGCSTDGGLTFFGDCSGAGGEDIRYRSPRGYLDSTTGLRGYAYYKYEAGRIWACLEKDVATICDGSTGFQPITSEGVTIEKMKFYVLGVDEPTKQPRMIMTITGVAGIKEKTQTHFDLQTSVSQRVRHFPDLISIINP